ncbi:MAG: hypothetical protein KDJ98_07170 [Rhodobacteraceae bacterium]|nr:hypothetical protein [Paracoccaceae bacterium]
MMEGFLRAFRHSRDRHDIEAMSDESLRGLGMTRDQARMLNALPDDVPARVAAMARVHGLSDAEILADIDRWYALLQTCNQCRDLPSCHRFLAREDLDTLADEGPVETPFCPNTAVFAAMAAR